MFSLQLSRFIVPVAATAVEKKSAIPNSLAYEISYIFPLLFRIHVSKLHKLLSYASSNQKEKRLTFCINYKMFVSS